MDDNQPTVPIKRQAGSRGGARQQAMGAVLAVGVIVGALVAVASQYAKGYFLFSPGTAPVITASPSCKEVGGEMELRGGAPCVRLVLPSSKAHDLDGKLLMVDVEESTPGPLQWAEYELGVLGKQHEVVPVSDFTGGITSPSELGCQDNQEMASATEDAALAALAHLHYHVAEAPLGAEVTGVVPGSPASRAGIKCNDLITAVDGEKIRSAGQFTSALAAFKAGEVVRLTDQRPGASPAKELRVVLGSTPAKLIARGFPARGYLGVAVDTRVKPDLPFKVSIEAGDIGGPSAGLAFALAIVDALSGGRLTDGHVVAATGTISPSGQVGDVGGVREKTIAVERAGAQVFFVPVAEYANARSVASRGLKVVPVSTLDEAVATLHRLFKG
jgi:PDZ domain-containing protein